MTIKYYIVRHKDICSNIIITMKKLFSIISSLQTNYHFKLDFQKGDQLTDGKWLILDAWMTIIRKDLYLSVKPQSHMACNYMTTYVQSQNKVSSYSEAPICETVKKSCFPFCQTYKPTIILISSNLI